MYKKGGNICFSFCRYISSYIKLYGPFLWMGFNCLKATATSRRQFTFYHSVPRNSWYSFYRPRKDERLSRFWTHPVVFNTEPLDWESSALIGAPSSSKKHILKQIIILTSCNMSLWWSLNVCSSFLS